MSVQVLVTTMNLNDSEKLLQSLNINSSFVIGNQTDKDSMDCVSFRGNDGLVVSRKEKGVGRNRNITLEYATSDICILSDDDMSFFDGYPETVENVFSKMKDADVIIFNLGNAGNKRKRTSKVKKLNKYNYMNYGAARIAFRRASISYHGIFFNCNFGGGTPHSAGEDVLFVGDCISKGLNVYVVPETIATLLDSRPSTWFNGYDDKYLFDKGVFLAVANPKLAKIFALYLAVKHPEYGNKCKGLLAIYKEICKGIDYIKAKKYVR